MKVRIALLVTLLVAAATFVGAGTAVSNGITASATGAGHRDRECPFFRAPGGCV